MGLIASKPLLVGPNSLQVNLIDLNSNEIFSFFVGEQVQVQS